MISCYNGETSIFWINVSCSIWLQLNLHAWFFANALDAMVFMVVLWMNIWAVICEFAPNLTLKNIHRMPIEFLHVFMGRKVWNLCRISLRRAVFALAGTLRSLVFKFLWQSRMLLCRRNRDALCQMQQEQKSSDVRTVTIPKELNEFLRCVWLIIQSPCTPKIRKDILQDKHNINGWMPLVHGLHRGQFYLSTFESQLLCIPSEIVQSCKCLEGRVRILTGPWNAL